MYEERAERALAAFDLPDGNALEGLLGRGEALRRMVAALALADAPPPRRSPLEDACRAVAVAWLAAVGRSGGRDGETLLEAGAVLDLLDALDAYRDGDGPDPRAERLAVACRSLEHGAAAFLADVERGFGWDPGDARRFRVSLEFRASRGVVEPLLAALADAGVVLPSADDLARM